VSSEGARDGPVHLSRRDLAAGGWSLAHAEHHPLAVLSGTPEGCDPGRVGWSPRRRRPGAARMSGRDLPADIRELPTLRGSAILVASCADNARTQ